MDGGSISPAASISSITVIIRLSSRVSLNASRQAILTALSGNLGVWAATLNAAGTTVSNLNKSAMS